MRNSKLATARMGYHFLPTRLVETVLQEGLVPHSRKGFCEYTGERTFFWVELNDKIIGYVLDGLYDERVFEPYTMLSVDLSQLDFDLVYNDDAISGHVAAYTTATIPATALKALGRVTDFY